MQTLTCSRGHLSRSSKRWRVGPEDEVIIARHGRRWRADPAGKVGSDAVSGVPRAMFSQVPEDNRCP